MDEDERWTAFTSQIIGTIDQHGWMVQGVFPTEESPGVEFAYTVGLTAHDFPELIISGLPSKLAAVILNDLAGRVFDTNRRYAHGEVLSDVLGDDLDVTIVEGPCRRDDLWPGTAYRLYGMEAVGLQQVVWPDRENRFPWDVDYALPAEAQHTIGRP